MVKQCISTMVPPPVPVPRGAAWIAEAAFAAWKTALKLVRGLRTAMGRPPARSRAGAVVSKSHA